MIATGGFVGILVLLMEKWTGWLMPFKWVLLFAFIMRGLKVIAGYCDKRWLKMGQASQEYGVKKKLSLPTVEIIDRIKNIEKKISPETFQNEHDTFLE